MICSLKKIFLLWLVIISSSVVAGESVDIVEPDKVRLLVTIQENLDAVSSAVMKCIESGRKHADCLCRNNNLIIRFNKSVDTAFSSYPDFAKLDLVGFKTPDGRWISQSLKNIRKQASMKPACS